MVSMLRSIMQTNLLSEIVKKEKEICASFPVVPKAGEVKIQCTVSA